MLLSKFASSLLVQSRRLPLQAGGLIAKQPVRHASKRVLYMFVSKGGPAKFRKYWLKYTLIGVVPTALIIFYTSYIVGEAELYDYDPEQYQPEYYEFFGHPITRFLGKYCMEDPRISYYKTIYAIEFETHHKRMIQLTKSNKEIEKFLGFRNWHGYEEALRNTREKEALDKYVEDHEIGVKVKR